MLHCHNFDRCHFAWFASGHGQISQGKLFCCEFQGPESVCYTTNFSQSTLVECCWSAGVTPLTIMTYCSLDDRNYLIQTASTVWYIYFQVCNFSRSHKHKQNAMAHTRTLYLFIRQGLFFQTFLCHPKKELTQYHCEIKFQGWSCI